MMEKKIGGAMLRTGMPSEPAEEKAQAPPIKEVMLWLIR